MGQAWKLVRYPLIGFLALMSILVPLDNYLSGFSVSGTGILMNFVVEYAVQPLAWFTYVLHHSSEFKYYSNYTFRQILPSLAWYSGIHVYAPFCIMTLLWFPCRQMRLRCLKLTTSI